MSYSFLVQNDIPLITWRLDETSGSTLASDNFMSGYNGTLTGTLSTKKTPIIFGSPSSIMVNSGNTVKIPSMGMMTNRYKSQPMTLEFWVKPKNGLAVYPRQQLVQLGSTANGIYVENSSFIAIIGDSISNSHRIVVPVENFNKPFHVVMSYTRDSFSLYINGVGSSVRITKNVFTDTYATYNTANQFFYFKAISGKPYALDNITIYTYAMDSNLAKRHMTYGLGYKVPDGFENYFGGYRFSLCMNQTKSVGQVEKFNGDTWLANSDVTNMVSHDGVLRIANLSYPELGYASDKTESVFTWGTQNDTTVLKIEDGGYLQINPKVIDPSNNGFAVLFNGLTNNAVQTLMLLQDPLNREYFIKIFAEGTAIKYQINNASPVQLRAAGNISGDFTVGYFYDYQNDSLKLFFSNGSDVVSTIAGGFNTKIFTTSHASVLRIGSNDVFSSNENFSDLTSVSVERYLGYIKRIVHLSNSEFNGSILTNVSSRINNYTAVVDATEKRFIIKAAGQVKFKVDAKKLAGPNKIIGANRVEWGYDGLEVGVKINPIGATSTGYADYAALDAAFAYPATYQDLLNTNNYYFQLLNNPESSWFSSNTIVTNRSCIASITGEEAGVTKAIEFVFTITCQDVIENPTKITFFRLFAYDTKIEGSEFVSEISTSGLPFKYTFTKDNRDFNLPEYLDTPFLWCEEDGGFKVGRTAYIDYNTSPLNGGVLTSNTITTFTGGLKGVAFFLNVPTSGTKTILNITKGATTATLTISGSTLTATGGTVYVNGVQTTSCPTGEWQHIIFVLTSAMTVSDTSYPRITFGATSSGSADFHIDEIMTFADINTTSEINEIEVISQTYRSIYIKRANDSINYDEFFFSDNEINNPTEIYQPMIHITNTLNGPQKTIQSALLGDVDLATTVYRDDFDESGNNLVFTYTGPNSLLIDGTYLQNGERILVKDQLLSPLQNGIFTVTIPAALDPGVTQITLTRVSPDIEYMPGQGSSYSEGGVVYVKDGVSNKGIHFIRSSAPGFEPTYIVKKVDAYTYEGPAQKTEFVARKTIPV